jgi:hypothetical protein
MILDQPLAMVSLAGSIAVHIPRKQLEHSIILALFLRRRAISFIAPGCQY